MMQQTAQAPSIAYLQEVIESQKRVILTQRKQLAWFTNSKLPIAARFAGYAVQAFTQERDPGEDGRYKAYLPTMAEQAGISASTISRGVQLLADATDALEKQTAEEWDENGNKRSTLYIHPTDLFHRPAEIEPNKEIKKHGGRRVERCTCGSDNIVETKKWVCAACGEVYKEFPRRPVNDPLHLAMAPDLENETPPDEQEPLQDAMGGEPEEPLLSAILPVDTGVVECDAPLSPAASPPLQDATAPPPEWLRRKTIWCPWRYEEPKKPRAGGKLDKVPYQTHGRVPQKAESDNPATWSTYEEAQAFYEQSRREGWKRPFDGIGLMCDGSFVGIDLDHCRDKETGEWYDWALEIVARFASYTYVTPSGEGLRLIIRAKKPGARCKKGDIELYEEKRFFTWTPEQLPGAPDDLADDCQAELDALYKEVWPDPLQDAMAPKYDIVSYLPRSCPAERVLEKARGAANGAKFIRLYDQGDITGYPSQSEADLALCELLSYWGAGGDVSTIDGLFRHSCLMRSKWDEPARAGEGTYGEGTIARAIALATGEQERRAS